jgi:hypothetical protein
MPDYNQIRENNNNLKNSIKIFKAHINDIITKLDKISGNIEILDEINNFLIENAGMRNRNFVDIKNINEINSNILNMSEEINDINNINNDSIKLINMFDIYKKLEDDSYKTTENIILRKDNNIDSQESISKEQLEPIIDQMNNCICEIYISRRLRGTGFFVQIPSGSKDMKVLITNNQLLGEEEFKKNTKIRLTLNNGKEEKVIKLDDQRKRYTNEISDITIIEIKKGDQIYIILN